MQTWPNRSGAFILCFLLFCSCSETNKSGKATEPPIRNERVSSILNSMCDGSWQGRSLPKFDWEDVDALLVRADSKIKLKTFPSNPLSSQAQFSCTEGMMAMWLIESVRNKTKSGYPSLNPLCFSAQKKEGTSWEEMSDANVDGAAQAYRTWWQKVKTQDVKKREEIDPLKEALLYWY